MSTFFREARKRFVWLTVIIVVTLGIYYGLGLNEYQIPQYSEVELGEKMRERVTKKLASVEPGSIICLSAVDSKRWFRVTQNDTERMTFHGSYLLQTGEAQKLNYEDILGQRYPESTFDVIGGIFAEAAMTDAGSALEKYFRM